jgi:UDP-N-acetylmuramoylalanine--D-glutamate ligase
VAATILNVCEDHLDRYDGMPDYVAAKQAIYARAQTCVCNAADAQTLPQKSASQQVSFGTGGDWHLQQRDGSDWLYRGDEPLLALSELRVPGRHNGENALAALALGDAAGLPLPAMLDGLRGFAGLPHRCQWVGERAGVNFYDDSKGTNVGATLAALAGFVEPVVLIAGGVGKDQDFSPLRAALAESARALVLIGRDAHQIERAVAGACPTQRAESLDAAVARAAELAESGDAVLLSPACASFDMFPNYVARGKAFAAAVGRLCA